MQIIGDDNNSQVELFSILFLKRVFFFSLTHVMVEKVLFWGKIFEMEILIDVYVIRSPESEIHIFRVWSVCLLSAQLINKL